MNDEQKDGPTTFNQFEKDKNTQLKNNELSGKNANIEKIQTSELVLDSSDSEDPNKSESMVASLRSPWAVVIIALFGVLWAFEHFPTHSERESAILVISLIVSMLLVGKGFKLKAGGMETHSYKKALAAISALAVSTVFLYLILVAFLPIWNSYYWNIVSWTGIAIVLFYSIWLEIKSN